MLNIFACNRELEQLECKAKMRWSISNMGLAIGGESEAACMLGAGMVNVSATPAWLHGEGQRNNSVVA